MRTPFTRALGTRFGAYLWWIMVHMWKHLTHTCQALMRVSMQLCAHTHFRIPAVTIVTTHPAQKLL